MRPALSGPMYWKRGDPTTAGGAAGAPRCANATTVSDSAQAPPIASLEMVTSRLLRSVRARSARSAILADRDFVEAANDVNDCPARRLDRSVARAQQGP